MEFEEEEVLEPVSPSGQYLKSSALSLTILAVLEFEVPIDDLQTMSLLKDVFLPINPRFSSVMVTDKNGVKKWKQVEVKLQDHVQVPVFPNETTLDIYDDYFNDYLSMIAMDQLPQDQPLWEVHIIKYPTSNAAGSVVFKLHHALGDGYSLMGALLSCLQRADDPSLLPTFPSRQLNLKSKGDHAGCSFHKFLPRIFSGTINTVLDFGSSLLRSSAIRDDRTPIRSGGDGVEFQPITITTVTFHLDHIKEIKTKLKVTINDVITGIITYGTRLYMQGASNGSTNADSTVLVLLNTRGIGGYKSVSEMVKPNAEMPWGNHFAFLHIPIPKLTPAETSNPLSFIFKAHRSIKRKRNSAAIYLTSRLLETLRKVRGPEATARYIHRTLKNSSMTLTNMIGPVEQVALANHPVKGIYFAVLGSPQSLEIAVMSYVGKLRVAVVVEKGFIDPHLFKSSVENAFEMIFKAAASSSLSAKS